MRILAVETSTRTGGVALLDGETVLADCRLNVAATHAERVLGAVHHVLRAGGLRLGDLDGLAVAVGPGSFTGLRIGVATVKGLAFAIGRPVAAVPTLEALAWSLPYAAPVVCPILDARKREVYAAFFRTEAGRLCRLGGDRAVAPEVLAMDVREARFASIVFLGDAVAAHAPVLARLLGDRARFAPPHLRQPSAVTVAELGLAALVRGEAVDPAGLTPRYVRRSEAELVRERHAIGLQR